MMRQIKIDSENIVKIRYALRELLLEAQHIQLPITRQDIIEQGNRIDKLLPKE